VLLAFAATVCLGLTACGAGPAASGAASPGRSAVASTSPATRAAPGAAAAAVPLTGNFCADLVTVEKNIRRTPASQTKTFQGFRRAATAALASGAADLSALAPEAPARIAGAVRTLVAAYRSQLQVIAGASTMRQINQALARAVSGGRLGAAAGQMARYMTSNCG
jgi:hypothetical protein